MYYILFFIHYFYCFLFEYDIYNNICCYPDYFYYSVFHIIYLFIYIVKIIKDLQIFSLHKFRFHSSSKSEDLDG